MDENTSLINIGELSRPATVLVEKISDAVGGIFKPYQVVRVAKAEAQADRIRAEGQIEVSDLQRRAFHRFLTEEATKQRNIEDITQRALPLLNEDSKPNEVEDDWITHFFDRCRLVSDDDMQTIWSRVLAGQANSPGCFSKRTVNFLSGLDKADAELFTEFCGFTWDISGLIPLIYEELADFYGKHGIFGDDLRNLQSLGLINHSASQFYQVHPAEFNVSYYDAQLVLKPADRFHVGVAVFTRIGKELMPICGSKPVDGFFDATVGLWKQLGHI